MFPALLTVDEFRSRTIMPGADVRRARGVQWKKLIDDATANAVTAETFFGKWEAVGTVLELDFVPSKSVAADPTNYATLTVSKRTGGGAPVVLGSVDTSATSWTAGVQVAIPITVGAIASGDALTVAIAKVSAGVIVPAGELFVCVNPSFLETAIGDWSSEFISRLSKRYDAPTDANPWPAPVTNVLKRWLAKVVTRDVYAKRGWSPSSEQDQDSIEKAADDVDAKLKEASDGQNGLFELYLGEDATAESVARAGPLAYSEQSPYTASRLQRVDGRVEDEITGTGGRPTA